MRYLYFSACCLLLMLVPAHLFAQQSVVKGIITGNDRPLGKAVITVAGNNAKKTMLLSDSAGAFTITQLNAGEYNLHITATEFESYHEKIKLTVNDTANLTINMKPRADASLEEVVISGTLRSIRRSESPVSVEIITSGHFKKNPTPSLFEAVGMVNGVQPQLNCNVCNTGDIHINGMEGPYTMILIDGMPIVSALSTVYGLSGIPNSMVERIEVVKGPASSLYGSEAMGGLINVITKNPLKAPAFSADVFMTSSAELSADAAVKYTAGKATGILGVNYFRYQKKADVNHDNFTDVTLQDRISLFNKWSFYRKDNRMASVAFRYVYEDRWGGELGWRKAFRGTDILYGESIYTNRAEVIGLYQLPVKEKLFFQYSFNAHDQNSYYGTVSYMAKQQVAFAQLYWEKAFGKRHNFLAGMAYRHTYYDDNTVGTLSRDGKNSASVKKLPGVFIQDEWAIAPKHKLLAGYRYDHDDVHGNVHSPRIAYKYTPTKHQTLRASFGTGFRVVNLFTEDHAALTGAREVVIAEALNPERSFNANLNYVIAIPTKALNVNFDLTVFRSYFTNKIIGDFNTDPNKIIYNNLDGFAVSQGVSLNSEFNFNFPLKVTLGVTYLDVFQKEKNAAGTEIKSTQLFAPDWSGNFTATWRLRRGYTIDLTGKFTGPMRLPIVPNDYRPEYSPFYSIMNIQLTKKINEKFELYGGLKNIFNFLPKDPILRPFDPFDRQVNDPVNNPYNYTFDPNYSYASMQGIRGFAGVRFTVK